MAYMRSVLSSKNQITLPREVRETLKVNPKDVIEYIVVGNSVKLQKVIDENKCPICMNGLIENRMCSICGGKGYFNSPITMSLLIGKLNSYLIDNDILEVNIVKDDLIGYLITVSTEDNIIVDVVSRVQFEILKMSLLDKDSLMKDEKNYILNTLKFKNNSVEKLLNLI